MRNMWLLAVFALALVVFGVLHSSDYMMVDGAARSLEVMRHPALFLHGNNHLLYPVYVFAWTRLLGALGFDLSSPAAFITAAQLMNALAAAITLTALCWLILRISGSWVLAAGGAAAYGLARALLLHATNGAEPMTGLAWSLLAAVAVVRAVDRRSVLLAAAGGVCLALAMASYQAMVLIGPGLLLYAWLASPRGSRATPVMSLLGAGALTTIVVYGLAYAHEGITGPGAMLSRFVRLDGAPRVWGGLRLTKLPSLALGLADGLVPAVPTSYLGWRSLLHGALGVADTLRVALCLLLVMAGVLWLAWRGLRTCRLAEGGVGRAAWLAGGVALAGSLAPTVYWDPLYEKLWLQPIAILVLGVCAVLASGGVSRVAKVVVSVLAGAGGVVNLAVSVHARVSSAPCLAQAEAVSREVRPQDLLVHEWDPVSFTFGVFQGRGRPLFDLVEVAKDSGAAAGRELDQARRAALARGGAVFYLGVFDLSRERWDAFLGSREGLPYDALAWARAHSQLVGTYACRGARVTLWREVGPAGFEPATNGL